MKLLTEMANLAVISAKTYRRIILNSMQKTFATRFAAAVMIIGSVFGAVAPALAAPATPVNLSIVGGKYTNDTTPTFTWTPAEGATWYEILLDNGSWQGIGNVSSYTYNTLSAGWHTFYLRAHDSVNGVSVSTGLTFEIDTKGPNVSAVSPLAAKTQTPVTFTVVAGSGDVMATYCTLNIDGYTYDMTAQFSSDARARNFTLSHTFDRVGSFGVGAKCMDADRNYTTGPTTTVKVSGSTTPSTPAVNVARGTVVKTQCGSYAPAGDACHAVYYYGLEGSKHLFPTESVFKSWYGSFNVVVTVSKSTMAAMRTGDDVTYRPGTALVKFASSKTVYAVDVNQTLRPIMNEAAAKAIYGSRWNSYVVTIPASQRNDYTIGSRIYSSADYSKNQAHHAVQTIDANWSVIAEM